MLNRARMGSSPYEGLGTGASEDMTTDSLVVHPSLAFGHSGQKVMLARPVSLTMDHSGYSVIFSLLILTSRERRTVVLFPQSFSLVAPE